MTVARSATRRWLPWLLSAVLSVGILSYLFSQIDPSEILRAARNLERRSLAAYSVLTIIGVTSRALRFWILSGRHVRLRVMVAITLARGLFIDLVPARLGEFSYVYLLNRRGGRPVEEGLSSLALAILFDIVAIGPLLILALVVVGAGEGLPSEWLVVASFALAAGAYLAISVAEPVARAAGDWLERTRRPGRTAAAAVKLRQTADLLRDTRGRRIFIPVFLLSVVVRLCKFGSYYFLVLAVMAPYGYTVETMGFFRVLLGVVGAELAAALPIHGIAGFGTFEGAWAFTFTQLGFRREHAIISGILAHALSQIIEYALGTLALLWLMGPSRRAAGSQGSPS